MCVLRLFGGKRSPDGIVEREHALECIATAATSFQVDSRPAEFSRRLKVFPPGQFAKNAAHRLLSQAGISVHNLGNGHACGEGLKNKRDGNARAAHTRTASKMLWATDNPVVHGIKLTLYLFRGMVYPRDLPQRLKPEGSSALSQV
jgi:hypothetical protein